MRSIQVSASPAGCRGGRRAGHSHCTSSASWDTASASSSPARRAKTPGGWPAATSVTGGGHGLRGHPPPPRRRPRRPGSPRPRRSTGPGVGGPPVGGRGDLRGRRALTGASGRRSRTAARPRRDRRVPPSRRRGTRTRPAPRAIARNQAAATSRSSSETAPSRWADSSSATCGSSGWRGVMRRDLQRVAQAGPAPVDAGAHRAHGTSSAAEISS